MAFEPQPPFLLFFMKATSAALILVSVITGKGLPLPHGPSLPLHFQLKKSKLPTFLISFSPSLQSFISGKRVAEGIMPVFLYRPHLWTRNSNQAW